MLSADLITYFYREIKDKERAEERLLSFARYTQDLVSGTFIGATASEEKDLLTREFSTWTLISNLFLADLVDTSESQSPSMFLRLDNSIRKSRELMVFIKLMTWLEQVKVVHLADRHVANWSRSVRSLSQRVGKRGQELDPDAAYREKRDIDEEDVAAERQMVKYGFEYVRAGKQREAQVLFADCGQAWRAASVGGLLPFFDFKSRFRLAPDPPIPSFMQTAEYRESMDFYERQEEDYLMVMGNAHYHLFLSSMWHLAEARKDQLEDSVYERALYGSLCGHYEAMSYVCRGNFYDHFWALVRTAVFISIDALIPKDEFEPSDSSPELLVYPSAWPRSFEGIARKLHSSHPAEAKDPFASFQLTFITGFILGDWNTCIDGLVLLHEHYSAHPSLGIALHVTRFCTHAAIIITTTKSLEVERKTKVDKLLMGYIRQVLTLRMNADLSVVGHYIRYIRNPALLSELVLVFLDEVRKDQNIEPIQRELNRYYENYLTPVISDLVLAEISKIQVNFDYTTALARFEDMEKASHRIRTLLHLFPLQPKTQGELEKVVQTARDAVLAGLVDTGEIILQTLGQSHDEEINWMLKVIESVHRYRDFHDVLKDRPVVEDISTGYDPRTVIHKGITGQIYQRYQEWPETLRKHEKAANAALLGLVQTVENVRNLVPEATFRLYKETWVEMFKEWLTQLSNIMVELSNRK